MAYRSKQIDAAENAEIEKAPPAEKRLTHTALDLLALPRILLTPNRTFNVGEQEIPIHNGYRRWAWRSERSVELALGARAIANFEPEQVLEIGNVLPMAGLNGHTVVDKYERGPGVINEDIMDFDADKRFDLAISISTLEHVGWDETPQVPEKAGAALTRIGQMADQLLISIPLGYHRPLQKAFVNGPFDDVTMLVRASRTPRWERRPLSEMDAVEYGRPFGWGNGILVGVRGNPLAAAH